MKRYLPYLVGGSGLFIALILVSTFNYSQNLAEKNQNISIDESDLYVPEPLDQPKDADTIIPKSAKIVFSESTSKIRSFPLTLSAGKLSGKKIIVNQNDIVRIDLTMYDGPGEFSVPDFGISALLAKNASKMVEFQAAPAGSFVYYFKVKSSQSKFEKAPLQGVLLIVPTT